MGPRWCSGMVQTRQLPGEESSVRDEERSRTPSTRRRWLTWTRGAAWQLGSLRGFLWARTQKSLSSGRPNLMCVCVFRFYSKLNESCHSWYQDCYIWLHRSLCFASRAFSIYYKIYKIWLHDRLHDLVMGGGSHFCPKGCFLFPLFPLKFTQLPENSKADTATS